jgi:PAS domain S-box-containing protein
MRKTPARRKSSARKITQPAAHGVPGNAMQQLLYPCDYELSTILNSMQDEVWFFDQDGKLLLVNRAVVEEFGPGIVKEKDVQKIAASYEVYRPDGTLRPADEAPPLRALRGETVIKQEEIVRTSVSGELRYRQVTAAPVKDHEGKILGSISVVRDITEQKRAEEALRRSEERFRSLSNASLEAIMIHDRGKILNANLAFARLFGYENQEEVVGLNGLDILLTPESRDRIFGRMERQEEGPMELVCVRKDGSLFAAETDSRELNYLDQVARIVSCRDITERKRGEEALWESEQQLRQARDLLEAVTTGTKVLIASIDRDFRYTYFNKEHHEELRRLTGKDTAIGMSLLEMLSDMPDEREKAMALWSRALNGETIVQTVKFGDPGRYSKWYSTHHTPIRNEIGQIVGAGEVTSDITASVQAQEALRESEEKYRNLFENMTEEVHFWRVVRDERGEIKTWRLVDANPPALKTWGRSSIDEIRGKTTDEIFGPGATQHYMPIVRKIMEDGCPHSFEDYFQNLDKHFRFASVPLGEYFITTGADITPIKKSELALRESEKHLKEANAILEQKVRERTQQLSQRADQLRALASELTLVEQRERSRLARVLHDHLQQLLVAAKFRTTILGRVGDDVIKKATREVEDLIDESISASRALTAELSPPILYEAGLNAGLRWLASRMAETHGLFVDLELEEIEPLPEASKILLFESIRELLFNVVKHANVLSALVSLRQSDGSLRVIVSDRGKGFDPTSLPDVGVAGRGFGLFIISERLELMGGSFKIESKPDEGSRFVLSMPLASPNRVETQPKQAAFLPQVQSIPPISPDPERRIRVMLVDDHTIVRQGMANLLGNEPDIEVVGQAADGQEAIEMASRVLPHVILMDTSMPKLNGVEATRKISNDWPEIRVIGLSMFEESERAKAMRDAGAADYITKSGPADNLLNAIRRSIQRSGKA